MAWENIEERLVQPFTVKLPHEHGVVWLPGSRLDIDEWLTGIARSDEELKELNIRRIRFLQNRWPIEKLLQLEWEGLANRRVVLAMYVHHRAYILFFDGFTYRVVGAVEPKDEPELYQAVIQNALQDAYLVPTAPRRIQNLRPDLVPNSLIDQIQHHHQVLIHQEREIPKKRSYLAKLLVGWVGNWIELPVLGYWHDDEPAVDNSRERKKAG